MERLFSWNFGPSLKGIFVPYGEKMNHNLHLVVCHYILASILWEPSHNLLPLILPDFCDFLLLILNLLFFSNYVFI